ncbi:hypothetical protein GOP47_0018497 [Adiantum capillus-veneris]|uniref:protein-S-isoprenylcysteine alpha-carbonyl methylesterase n=1 Tax=Adiantum capillus-veneris TaxID=13818 RepID=A0A9D4Z874_ADICA|nr:hypothetical protein GOP47_0018497 [Adiantum capillus-veneris]
MTLAMVLGAIHGAAAHVASTPGAWPKAKLAARLTYVFVKEILGMALALPSVSRSLFLHSSLPSHPKEIQPLTVNARRKPMRLLRAHLQWVGSFNVSVARNIPYGTAKRNLLDVYVPDAVASDGELQRWPAVVFVHGGAWATGSKELFSHLGACLAHSGVLTVLVQYTLFPEVLAWQQVREISLTLTWLLDNVQDYGGDPQRVTLMGHSAGAHLCALVIWERFKAAQQLQQRRVAAEARSLALDFRLEIDEEDDLDEQDTRQPHNFIGMAGVYDIVEHLKFERKRGVDTMSSMTPAMGGKHLLEAMSPVHLFQSVGSGMSMVNTENNHGFINASIDEAVLDKMNHLAAIDAGLCAAIIADGNSSEIRHKSSNNEGADLCVRSGGGVCQSHLPSCTLMCSWNDMVVRPDTSISFHAVLQEELGHQSQLILFNDLAHSDFVNLDGRAPEQALLRRHILRMLEP